MVIEAIFFHDFTFVPGDGFGRDFVQGGDFTDIKAMNNSEATATCDFDTFCAGSCCRLSLSRPAGPEPDLRTFLAPGQGWPTSCQY